MSALSTRAAGAAVVRPRGLLMRGVGRWYLAIWLAAALIGVALAVQPAHPLSDVTHYKLWARLVVLQGVAASYSGQYPETYAIYPPVTMYGLAVVGWLYERLVDPSFEREAMLASGWLTTAIRLLALSVHLLLGVVLLRLLHRNAGPRAALVGGGVYLLNPGALWDVAVWAQPDPWHSLFALFAVWSFGRGRSLAGGAWTVLALLTKPQAWALLPLLSFSVLRGGLGRVAEAALGGAVAGFVVLLPYALEGRLRELLTLPGQISSIMPVASANAHNLWWLVTRGAFPFVLDSDRFVGPLSYRAAALGLVGLVLLFTLRQTWRVRGPWELAGLAAYFSHAWFTLITSAHENHGFLVIPFLCLVWWRSRFLAVLLALLVALFTFNILVHDFGLEPLFALLGRWSWRLQMAASALNILILLAWTAWLLRPSGGPGGSKEASGRTS